MEDYKIRDNNNRALAPDAQVTFAYRRTKSVMHIVTFILQALIENSGDFVINSFCLKVRFPRKGCRTGTIFQCPSNVTLNQEANGDYAISYYSRGVLFQKEKREIGNEIQ